MMISVFIKLGLESEEIVCAIQYGPYCHSVAPVKCQIFTMLTFLSDIHYCSVASCELWFFGSG
jgi:hypothetical protein